MDLVLNYEQDYLAAMGTLQLRLQNLPNLTTDQKLNEIRKSDNELQDAEDMLQSMNLNARNVPGPQGAKLQTKIREYEAELSQVKKQWRRADTLANEAVTRETLIGNSAIMADMSASTEGRQRLLDQGDRLAASSARIKDALRTAEDTTAIGAQVAMNLEGQTNQMHKGLDKLGEINDKLSRGSKIMSGMARRVATNKLIMAVIVLVLVGAMVLIIWLKWFHN